MLTPVPASVKLKAGLPSSTPRSQEYAPLPRLISPPKRQRIKAAAEQDAKNVIAAAEQEIAAASRTAQRELKSFVADLAVDLAEKKIKVDQRADEALLRSFAAQLGKDGQ